MLKPLFPGWFLFCLSSLVLLTSCDNDPEPRNRFDFAAGTNYTSGNRNITPGEIISTSLYAETASANTKFTKLTITCNYDTSASITGKPSITYLDSALNSSILAMVFTIGSRGRAPATQTSNREYWTFTLEDDQQKKYEKKYRLVSTNTVPAFQTYSSVFYHKSALENIKYFSTTNGMAYPGYIGRQNAFKDTVDFFFQVDDLAQNTFSLRSTEDKNKKLKTTFRPTSLTTEQFTALNTVAAITETYSSVNPANERSQITKSKADPVQIVAFKTARNKFGVMRLDTLQVLPAGISGVKTLRMPYSIKMQNP
jgi:hypothetical protein